MTYRALLVGNSTFDSDASLNPLNAPTKDVARLHRALVDAETGLFDDENVRLVTERRHDEILDELDEFFRLGQRSDLMLFYYSGHGLLDEHNHLYLCGRDTRSDRLARSGISDDDINRFIRNANSNRTVIVLDCCSSGMFKGGSISSQIGGPGRYVVTSTRGTALANDALTPTGTSLFTEHLVEGMLGGAADTNDDGLIDLHEIYEYVKRRLAETSKQVPHCRFDGDADVSLARIKQPPAIAKVAESPAAAHHRSAPFGLSENVITLRDVDLDEKLDLETVEIYHLTDDNIDLVAETRDQWLRAWLQAETLLVEMHPHAGTNRGKVLVRDRLSGHAQVLRLEVFARAPRVARHVTSAPEPSSKGAANRPTTSPALASAPPFTTPVQPQPRPPSSAWPPSYRQPPSGPPSGKPGYVEPTLPPRNGTTKILAAAAAALIVIIAALVVALVTRNNSKTQAEGGTDSVVARSASAPTSQSGPTTSASDTNASSDGSAPVSTSCEPGKKADLAAIDLTVVLGFVHPGSEPTGYFLSVINACTAPELIPRLATLYGKQFDIPEGDDKTGGNGVGPTGEYIFKDRAGKTLDLTMTRAIDGHYQATSFTYDG